MTFVQPTKCRFRTFTLKGADLRNHISRFQLYETINKPYFTAKGTFIDNQNIIDNLKLVPGDVLEFAFDAGYGLIREGQLHVLSTDEPRPSQSLRSQLTSINFIGGEYYKDESNVVQKSFSKGIIGTQAIQHLHSQFIGTPLQILSQSLGPLSQESHVISSLKPFTAINRIKDSLTYALQKTGNTLYFRDKDSHILGPLESLFQQFSPQADFVQKATWGANWFDIADAVNGVIALTVTVDPNMGGRTSATKTTGAVKQGKHVFDIKTKKFRVEELAKDVALGTVAGSAGALLEGIKQFTSGSMLGGSTNYSIMDSAKKAVQNHESAKNREEKLYQALVANGPMVTMKVPIQSGINCTVGKGIYAKLLPPSGDYNGYTMSSIGGNMLVTDLCHDLANDDRMVNGTTTMKCVKAGLET